VSCFNVLLQISLVNRCSLPRTDSRPRLHLFGPGRSFKQNAVCHPGISESRKNLSVGVIR
jgi:hypothetical protein